MIQFSYLVFYCLDLEATRDFYSRLGLELKEEQHGRGAFHYSAVVGDVVLEFYPSDSGEQTGSRYFGMSVQNRAVVLNALGETEYRKTPGGRIILTDPDGRSIDLSEATEATNAEEEAS